MVSKPNRENYIWQQLTIAPFCRVEFSNYKLQTTGWSRLPNNVEVRVIFGALGANAPHFSNSYTVGSGYEISLGRFGEERIVTVLKIHQITRNKTENQRQVNFIHPTVIKADIRNKKMQFAV